MRSLVAKPIFYLAACCACLAAAHASAGPVAYTGTASDVSAQFGGPPYCNYRVTMTNLRIDVTVDGSAVKSASVTGTMTESFVGSCTATATNYGTRPNSWSLSGGTVSGNTVTLSLAGAASNVPGSSATFSGVLAGQQLTGSLTIRRTDQSGNLAWVLTTPVTASASHPVAYTGRASDVSAQFGGLPYCDYRVTMTNLRIDVTVDGSAVKSAGLTGTMTESFVGSCTATPTNYGTRSNSWSLSGGTVSGNTVTVSLAGAASNVPGSSATFSGTLDGQQLTGSLTIRRTDQTGNLAWVLTTPVTANTTQLPPFDMTVTSSITPTTSSATVQIQFPPTDVGRTASIFVFAYAPKSLVKSAPLGKDAGDNSCVLAQPDPATGQLAQTSASGLRPYLSNTLLTQNQAVTLLNNASTAANAGASYFVGYGSDASSMIASGVNRGAVTIPGAKQCPDRFPATPESLSGLWFDVAEQGWGIHFTQRGVHVFAAWFTYDASGNAKWYVASDCTMANAHATSGPCSGDLYEVAGPQFFGAAFDAGAVHANPAGHLQVDFADPAHATMTFTASGVTRSVPIVRQPFGSGATPPPVDYTDLWWNPNESGWGMAITHQYNVMFLAWFVFDNAGKPVWYVASDCQVSGDGCSGSLYRVTGPPFGPTFNPSAVHPDPAGTVTIIFTDPNNGVLNSTIGGVAASKAITRQLF